MDAGLLRSFQDSAQLSDQTDSLTFQTAESEPGRAGLLSPPPDLRQSSSEDQPGSPGLGGGASKLQLSAAAVHEWLQERRRLKGGAVVLADVKHVKVSLVGNGARVCARVRACEASKHCVLPPSPPSAGPRPCTRPDDPSGHPVGLAHHRVSARLELFTQFYTCTCTCTPPESGCPDHG